ncbi:hypothetical protein PM082_012023 [Marasmius tenuissimus]|nr:hypothetical protein PM082_012023 [Marasmius tenuissimus]
MSAKAQHSPFRPVSTSYNFTAPGKGTYDIHARNLFLYVHPATNKIAELQATHEAFLTASFAGSLSNARRHASRATSQGCSTTQQNQIALAIGGAAKYASSSWS